MLNIALISEHASPIAPLGGVDSGGQNVYVAHVARQLAALGHGVDIYTRCDSPLQQRVMEWGAGIRIVNVPAGPARFLPKEALLPYMDEFSRFMIDFARDENLEYDVVHANFFMSGMVAREFKLATGTPFVITFHALGKVRRMNQGQDDGFLDERFEIEEMLMREAARVIAECEQDSLDMQTLYGADRRRIDVVPCGFDPEELWPVSSGARLKLGLPENEFIILQLGRIVRRKGIDNVIRAAGELRRRHGIASRLLVVGGNSPIPD
ncbi:MAG: glycosyltransferase, partial [Burkholderiaceae bacterium]|nr:glycosyltransferase [Burkholderiaceae bacterium]